MSEKINLVFFAFGSSIPLVNELNAFYKNSQKFDINNLTSAEEVNQFLGTTGQGIFFFKVTNKTDLQKAFSVLKAQKKLIKKGFVKPACVTTIKSKKVETVLAKYGCVDLLEPDTRAKTASFKLDFWSKPITAHLEQVAKEEELKLKNQNKDNESTDEKENFKYITPLDLKSDFWIAKHKNDCKKVLRKWLLRILGPSPFIGNWVELQAQPGDKLPTWKFVLKDPTNTDYIVDEGAWFFYGDKPEFDWEINRWSFSSDLPHLYFYSKAGKVFSRFKFLNNQVEICNNSDFALVREEMILETCDAQCNFDGDKSEEGSNENLDGSEDNLGPGHLAGANHQEEDLGGNMGGKSSTDDLGGDPLAEKVNRGDELANNDKGAEGEQATEGSIYDKDGKPIVRKDDLSEYQVMDGFNANQKQDNGEDESEANNDGYDKLTHPAGEVPVVDGATGDPFANIANPFDSPKSSSENSAAELQMKPVEGIFDNSQDLPISGREADMLDALGGGMSAGGNSRHYEGSDQSINLKNTIIGEENKKIEEEEVDLNQIIDQKVDLDLESGQLKVVLKQKTNVGNDITFICEFEDFYEDELVVKAPKNSLAVETEVRAMVSLLYKGQKIKVECSGIIEEIEELSEQKDTLIISLTKINKESYEIFINLYQERQGSINEFMEMAKGY